MSCQPAFAARLLSWFDREGRKDLPWQQNKTPYRVWVSEIMLQQTQVSAVIDYYQRFMTRFPDLKTLALADQDAVLEHWAGLGYYARARNLHACAQKVWHEYGGEFPRSVDALQALPGIGRSTAGAIFSIAMGGRGVILDGNVKRVLTRYRAISGWPGKREIELQLWQLADSLTPDERVDDYTQAIMDLGATLCSRSKPDCARCPMQRDCSAYAQNEMTLYPSSKPKKTIPMRHTRVAVVLHEDRVLLEKRPSSGIWGGLYSLPEHEHDQAPNDLASTYTHRGVAVDAHQEDEAFVHVFSHYKLTIHPLVIHASKVTPRIKEEDHFGWYSRDEIKKLGLPAPISRYLQQTLRSQSADAKTC